MGLLGKLWVKLGLDSSEFKKGVNDADKATTSFKDRLKTIGQAVGVAFGIGAIVQFGRKVIQTRGEFESLEISFRTLLRSKAAADQLMAQMVDLAARTPFSLQEVATGAKQLLAYGFAASEVRGTLSQLGDVAAGLGLPMERLTYLYGTTRTQGRLFARDLMQFTTSGVPLLDELAKMFGKSTEEINKMVSAGDIGFEEVKQAFGNMTGEAGKFYNLMEERSKGISGKISNLGDAISVMFNKIGQSQEGAINSALDGAKFLVDNYQEVWKILKSLIYTYGTYKAVLITVAAAQKAKVIWDTVAAFNASTTALRRTTQAQILFNRTALANPYVLLASAIAGVVGALVLFGGETNKANGAYSAFALKLQQEKSTLADLKKALNETTYGSKERADIINLINQRYTGYLSSMLTEKNSIEEITSALTKANEKLTENLRLKLKASRLEEIQSTQLGVETNFVSTFTGAYKKTDDKTPEQIALFANSLAQLTEKAREGGASVDDARKVLIALGHDAERVNGAIISSDNEISKELRNVVSWFNSIESAASEAGTQTAVLNALVADLGDKTVDKEKEVAETYRTRAEILADIKARITEISALEAKPKKTSSEIKNLEALRGELKTYEDEYKTFTGKEFGAKVKVETDKDKTKNALEGSIAYFENLLSKAQLELKIAVTDKDRAELQAAIKKTQAEIDVRVNVPKSERQVIEDAIKGYEDLQLAIPIGMGSPEEMAAAQAEWDRLSGIIKQAREEQSKFAKDYAIGSETDLSNKIADEEKLLKNSKLTAEQYAKIKDNLDKLKISMDALPQNAFPVGSLAEYDKKIADIESGMNLLTGSTLEAAQASVELLKLQKEIATNGAKPEARGKLGENIKAARENIAKLRVELASASNAERDTIGAAIEAGERQIALWGDMESAAEALAEAIGSTVTNAIGELASALGDSEGWNIGGFAARLLDPLGDAAIQAGLLTMGIGTALEALKTAFSNLFGGGPAGAIASGAALLALGVAAKAGAAAITKGQRNASGGANPNTFTGGYSNSGSSTRTAQSLQLVSPQSQTIVVKGEVSGDKLRFVLDKDAMRRKS